MNEDDLWSLTKDQVWYVVINDIMGGHAVANAQVRVSQLDWKRNECGVADFLSREAAEHICRLHNEELERGTLQDSENRTEDSGVSTSAISVPSPNAIPGRPAR